jgi:hypothetical protein
LQAVFCSESKSIRPQSDLYGLVEGLVVIELSVLMVTLLFLGLLGMHMACKNDEKVASRAWSVMILFSLSGFIAGLGLFFVIVVAASVIGGIVIDFTNPLSRLPWGIDYFVSVLTSNSALFVLPIILVLWLKYQGDESMSRTKLFLIGIVIVIPSIILISLMMALLFPGL